MKKTLILIVLTVFVLSAAGSTTAVAQQEPSGIPSGRTAAAPGRLFSQVVLRLMDGRFVTGLLLGFEDDAIVLRVGNGEVKVRRTDLALVTVERERKIGSLSLSGILLGLVAGNLCWMRPSGAPTGFVGYGSVFSALLDNALYGAGGGAILYLIGLAADPRERTFDFAGGDERRSAAWDEIRAYGLDARAPASGRWRLTVHSAYVFGLASNRFRDDFRSAGYTLYDAYSEGGNMTNVNVIRRIGVSHAVGRRFELGPSVSFLGEPGIFSYYSRPDDSVSTNLNQSFSGTAVFLTGSWLAFGSNSGNVPRMKLGIGLGAADIKIARSFESYAYSNYSPNYYGYYGSTHLSGSSQVHKTLVGALAFVALDVPLYQGLFIGLTADYVLLPAVSLAGFPEIGIPARRLSPGNASLGIGFGWIF
jgi:hypothetical protein